MRHIVLLTFLLVGCTSPETKQLNKMKRHMFALNTTTGFYLSNPGDHSSCCGYESEYYIGMEMMRLAQCQDYYEQRFYKERKFDYVDSFANFLKIMIFISIFIIILILLINIF